MFHFFGVIATFGYPKLTWLVSLKEADSLRGNLVLDVLALLVIGVKRLFIIEGVGVVCGVRRVVAG